MQLGSCPQSGLDHYQKSLAEEQCYCDERRKLDNQSVLISEHACNDPRLHEEQVAAPVSQEARRKHCEIWDEARMPANGSAPGKRQLLYLFCDSSYCAWGFFMLTIILFKVKSTD